MSSSETKNSQENPNKDARVKMILISFKNRINFHLDELKKNEFQKTWFCDTKHCLKQFIFSGYFKMRNGM